MQNIYSLVSEVICGNADKPALITNDKTYTYGELKAQIEHFESVLKNANAKKGNAVAVFLKNSIDFISLLFASTKNGIIMVPFSGDIKEHESHLNKIKPEFIVTYNNEKLNGEEHKLTSDVKLVRINDNSFKASKENIAFIRMTSGTTGKPKATVLSHETVINRIDTASKIIKINENDVIGWPLKMAYHFVVSLILYIKNGAAIKLLDEESILDSEYLNKTTIIYGCPSEIKFILDKQIELPRSLKIFYSTSFLLNEELARKFCEKYEHVMLVQLYGMIECGLPLYGEYKNNLGDFWASVAPNFEYKIEEIDELKKENCGLLHLKGKGFFDGYFGLSTYNNDWFNTGEVVELNSEGKLRVLGRLKAALRLDKKILFPENIEAYINSQFGIKQSRLFKENGGICLEYTLGANRVDQTEIKSYLTKELSFEPMNVSINEVKKVKKTLSGKIIR